MQRVIEEAGGNFVKIIVFILTIVLLTLSILFIVPEKSVPQEASAILVLGFTLMVAYLFGKVLNRFQLPKITGYLFLGILIGPYVTNIMSESTLKELQLIDNIALSLIALTAGGEFQIQKVKKQLSLILNVTLWQIIIVLLGITTIVVLAQSYIPFLNRLPFQAVVGSGLLFGVLSIAKSPATTIAIITETRARGEFTDFILGITILKDIIIVLLFAMVLSFAKPLILNENTIHFQFVFAVLQEIGLSLIAGFVVGLLIFFYIRYINIEVSTFLLGLFLLVIEFSHVFHLELILIFMMAGFVVQNFSNEGDKLIKAIEKSSLPIYVTFFALAGASLKLGIFLQNWAFTLLLVVFRMLTTHLGTYTGAILSRGSQAVRRYGWMGFVGQAGLTLGLSVIVERDIPGEIGTSIRTIIIASIAINQILGPILFRYALSRTGEIPDKDTPVSASTALFLQK